MAMPSRGAITSGGTGCVMAVSTRIIRSVYSSAGRECFTAQRVHESMRIDGRIERLRQPLDHYSYQRLGDVIARLDRYTDLAALDLRDRKRPFRVSALVIRPLGRFLRNYVLKQGFRDGIPGLIMAVSYAYSVFAREVKLWELTREHAAGA